MIRDDLEQTLRSKLDGAKSIGAVIAFDFGSDGKIVLDGKSTPPEVAATGPNPDATITLAATDMRDMLAGELSPMDAYTMGKLDVAGDMGAAMKLSSLLG